MLDGSYRYHADVREYNVDQLKLDFAVRLVDPSSSLSH